jgi:hypothetical protein
MGTPAFIVPIMGKTAGGYLPLTTAWIAATGETDTTILNALNTFEASLIANGMNTGDLIAYYPMVGGNETKHAFNFMNTSLYNLTFLNGWTHSATGALPNGTNGYATTNMNANTVLTQNNAHFSFYSRTNTATASRTSIGCYLAGPPNVLALNLKQSGNALAGNASNTAGQYPVVANSDSTGFYLSNKVSSAIGGLTLDKNGTQIAANTVAITTNSYPNLNILISTLSPGLQNDNKETAGVTIGLGLNSTKRGQLASMINTLNTALSRNVY